METDHWHCTVKPRRTYISKISNDLLLLVIFADHEGQLVVQVNKLVVFVDSVLLLLIVHVFGHFECNDVVQRLDNGDLLVHIPRILVVIGHKSLPDRDRRPWSLHRWYRCRVR